MADNQNNLDPPQEFADFLNRFRGGVDPNTAQETNPPPPTPEELSNLQEFRQEAEDKYRQLTTKAQQSNDALTHESAEELKAAKITFEQADEALAHAHASTQEAAHQEQRQRSINSRIQQVTNTQTTIDQITQPTPPTQATQSEATDPHLPTLSQQINQAVIESINKNASHINDIPQTIDALSDSNEGVIGMLQDTALIETLHSMESQVEGLKNLSHDISRRAQTLESNNPSQDDDEKKQKLTQATQEHLEQLKLDNAAIDPVITPELIDQVSEIMINAHEQAVASPHFKDQLDHKLKAEFSSTFNEVEMENISNHIIEQINQHAVINPDFSPDEIISIVINSELQQKHAGVPDADLNELAHRAKIFSQDLSVSSRIHQSQRIIEHPKARPSLFNNVDPWYALYQDSSPLSKYPGIVSRYTLFQRSMNNTHRALTADYASQLISGSADPDQKLTTLRSMLNGNTFRMYQQGLTSRDLEIQINALKNLPSWAGGPKNSNDHLQQLIQHQKSLILLEQALHDNPDTINAHTRWQRRWHNLKRTPARLVDRSGRRHKFAYLRRNASDKLYHLAAPVRMLYRPFTWVDEKVEAYNPIIKISTKFRQKVSTPIKRRIGAAMLKRGFNMYAKGFAKKGARAAVRRFAGKLLVKGGLALAGIATAGVGTAISLLLIAKDIIQMIGLKRLLKWLVISGAVIAGGLLYLLSAAWGLVKGIAASFLGGAAIGAGIGMLVGGPIGAAIGAAVGGTIGAIYTAVTGASVAAGIASATAATGAAIASAGAAVSTFMATLSTASLSTPLAAYGVAAAVGGTAVAYTFGNHWETEIRTLPVNPTTGGFFLEDPYVCENEGQPKPSNSGVIMSGNYAYPVINHGSSNSCTHYGDRYALDIFTGAGVEDEKNLPVVAYTDSEVVMVVNNDSHGGKFVILKGTDNRFYYYAHNCDIYVTVGDVVSAGEVIATTDHTGQNAEITPEHLHFAIQENATVPRFYGGGNVCPMTDIREKLGITSCDDPAKECNPYYNDGG